MLGMGAGDEMSVLPLSTVLGCAGVSGGVGGVGVVGAEGVVGVNEIDGAGDRVSDVRGTDSRVVDAEGIEPSLCSHTAPGKWTWATAVAVLARLPDLLHHDSTTVQHFRPCIHTHTQTHACASHVTCRKSAAAEPVFDII